MSDSPFPRRLALTALLAACTSGTSVRIPDEVAEGWPDLEYVTAYAYVTDETESGEQEYQLLLALSDQPGFCEILPSFTLPEWDFRVLVLILDVLDPAPGTYVPNQKAGPTPIRSADQVAGSAFVIEQQDGEFGVWVTTERLGDFPGATDISRMSWTIDEMDDAHRPLAGSFEFQALQDRGTARPYDYDAYDDGRLDFRWLDAKVTGRYRDAEPCPWVE